MITNVIYAVLVLGVIAVVFGLILSVAAKAFEVKVDERLPKIQACLAGANCGGCGYPGCAGCAEAILAGKAPVTACAPAGAEGAAKIAEIMGMEAPSGEKQVAHVLCNGGEASVKNFEYVGLHDCVAATKVAGGPTACSFGCMGFGTCVAACQFDAIHINAQGVAEVDKEKCTNCGACREACPRKLIVEVPYKQKVFVNCSNKEKGPAVTKVCANSCIACGMCERTCKFDAIHVVDGVAKVDKDKCTGCGACANICPKHVIMIDAGGPRKPVVMCSNQDKGAVANKLCTTSCIACGMCERTCQFDAIHVVDGVARVDYDKCKGCGMCAQKCPKHIILFPLKDDPNPPKPVVKQAPKPAAAPAAPAEPAAKAEEAKAPEAPKAE